MNKTDNLWLVSISAGRWQLSGIRAALTLGIHVFALDGDSSAPGLSIATKSAVVDIKDPQAVLSVLKTSGIVPDGVVSFVSEIGMHAAAVVREYYDLSGSNRILTQALTNKVKQREIWDKADVPGPKWGAFTSVSEAEQLADNIGWPCIVKPSDSAGSRGVTKVEIHKDLKGAAQKALDASPSKIALLEAFMQGTEYAIETFGDGQINHVLAVTEKSKVPGTKGTVAQELSTPNIDRNEQIVAKLAVEALNAIGYMTGPGHTEVILSEIGKAGLVEAAGRGGGFMVFERLIEKASGYDVVTATVLQAVGLSPLEIVQHKRAVNLRFFPSRPGIVEKINGFSDANKIPGVEAGAFVEIGQRVGNVQGDGDRLGYILSEEATPAKAKAAADSAESLINIKVA